MIFKSCDLVKLCCSRLLFLPSTSSNNMLKLRIKERKNAIGKLKLIFCSKSICYLYLYIYIYVCVCKKDDDKVKWDTFKDLKNGFYNLENKTRY